MRKKRKIAALLAGAALLIAAVIPAALALAAIEAHGFVDELVVVAQEAELFP